MIELIQALWDKVTGKTELRKNYIERINKLYDEDMALRWHLMKLYPNTQHCQPNHYIDAIVSGAIKINPESQYTDEELKEGRSTTQQPQIERHLAINMCGTGNLFDKMWGRYHGPLYAPTKDSMEKKNEH